MMLLAVADVALADASRYLPRICEHLGEHGAAVELARLHASVSFGSARGRLEVRPGWLMLSAEAPDLPALLSLRASLASHLKEFAGEAAGPIAWRGDGVDAVEPAEFRLMRVEAIEEVTPLMRRLTLTGPNLSRYQTSEHLHCKLLLPPQGRAPVWPSLGPDGLIRWPDGEDKLAVRKYTIRRVDAETGRMQIDFVRHHAAGPGSAFAQNARPGDQLALIGPGGLGVRAADWTLLAGDETALPAIARILEEMPRQARGSALIEVADEAEIQPLDAPASFDVRWLSRGGAPAGTTMLLADAVVDLTWPSDEEHVFAWAGCEFEAFKTLRRYFRAALALGLDQHHAVAYWRR